MLGLHCSNSYYDGRCDGACNQLFNYGIAGVVRYVDCKFLKADYCLQIRVLVYEPQDIIKSDCFCYLCPLFEGAVICMERKAKKLTKTCSFGLMQEGLA